MEHGNSFQDKIKDDFRDVLINNYKVWIPIQFMNFYIVPQNLRVLFQSVVGVLWMSYLSYAAHNKLHNF